MALRDAYRNLKASQQQNDIASLVFGQQQGFRPEQPGDPDFGLSTTPSSQAQFPAAAAEKRLYQNQTQAQNILKQTQAAGFDITQPEYSPIAAVAEKGFKERALTLGERLINVIDGGKQFVNLAYQDIIHDPAEGERDVGIGDYVDAIWGGIADHEKFKEETGLDPRDPGHTLDLLGFERPEDLGGKIARGAVTFGMDVIMDPLTYVTFGLSGLGKKVAMGVARRYSDDVVNTLMPLVKEGKLVAEDITNPFMRRIARNLDETTEKFRIRLNDDLKGETKDALWNYLSKHGYQDLDPQDTWALAAAAQENITELAIRNQVRDEVMAPLLRRDFAAIATDALPDLPKFVYGGARISFPFTRKGLEQGVVIPGTQGIGKKFVGDPLRKMSKNLRDKFPGSYNKMADRLQSFANHMDQDRALLRGVGAGGYTTIGGSRELVEEGIEGWQYHLVQTSLDRLHNRQNKEIVKAKLNSLKAKVQEAAKAAGIEDESKVWSTVMNRLEGSSASALVPNLIGGPTATAPVLALTKELDREIGGLSKFLRETFDAYHNLLAQFDEEAVDKYIKGYAPHQVTTEISAVLGRMASKGSTVVRKTMMREQQQGNIGAVLFAEMLNGIGKGGRIEGQLGASRYLNPRKEGRLAALTLTDQGTILFDEQLLKQAGGMSREVIDEAGNVSQSVRAAYMTAEELNKEMAPIIKRLAKEWDIPLPKDWDGKVFNTNPLDIASNYIDNLDEAISAWATADALRTAGLIVRHDSAPDAQAIIQTVQDNALANMKKIKTTTYGAPAKEQTNVPINWVKQFVDPDDYAAAKAPGATGILRGTEVDKKTFKVTRPAEKADMETFAADIAEKGMREPITIGIDMDGNLMVINGHHRLVAAEMNGETEIDALFRWMDGFDEIAENYGVNARPHLKSEMLADPNAVRVRDVTPEVQLSPDEAQLAAKFRNGIARTGEQSTLYKQQMRKLLRGELEPGSAASKRARAGARWWYSARERMDRPLFRALNDDEVNQIINREVADSWEVAFANADPTGDFAKSAGDAWVAEFKPGTYAAMNDLNQGMEIGKTGVMEDEWFVSGRFEITDIDHDAKKVTLEILDENILPGRTELEKTPIGVTNRPPISEEVPALFHGSGGRLTQELEPLERTLERGGRSADNLFGPGFYATSDPRVANTLGYGGSPEGTITRLEWMGNKAGPNVEYLDEPASDTMRGAVVRWAREHFNDFENRFAMDSYTTPGEDKTYMFWFDNYRAGDIKKTPEGWMWKQDTLEADDMPQFLDENMTFATAKEARTHLEASMRAWAENYPNQTWKLFADKAADPTATGEDFMRIARNFSHETGDADKTLLKMNIALRDEGIDMLHYRGGTRMGTREHQAYVVLDTESFRLIEEPSIKQFDELSKKRRAQQLGMRPEDLADWRRRGGPADEVADIRSTDMTADEVFNTVPWNQQVTERNVLKGYDKAASAASRKARQLGPEIKASAAGFNSVEDATDVAWAITHPDAYQNIVVKKQSAGMFGDSSNWLMEGFEDRARQYGFEDLRPRPGTKANRPAYEVGKQVKKLADGGKAVRWQQVGLDAPFTIDAVSDSNNRLVRLFVDRPVPIDPATGDRIVQELADMLTEFKTDKQWVDDVLFKDPEKGINYIIADEAEFLYEAMLEKINRLPNQVKELFTGVPAEHLDFEGFFGVWSRSLNDWIDKYAAHYDPNTGDILRGLAPVAGTDEFMDELAQLRKGAKYMSDEFGFKEVMKVFDGTNKFMGLADQPGFVNPAIFSLGGPALEGASVQADIAEWLRQLTRNAATIYTPEGVAALKMGTNSVLRWWKAMATIARPGFHIRNSIGGIWSNMMIGVGPQHYAAVGTHGITLRNALRQGLEFDEALKKLPKAERAIWQAAWDNDILSGFVSTEFRKLDSKKKQTVLSWLNVTDVDNFFATRVGGRFMESIEDFLRMSAFRTWYDPSNPSTAKVAKEMVEAVHFNYTKLTPFETKIKSIVPFFVWTRRNLPRQLEQMVENPRMIQRYRAMMNAIDDQFEDEVDINMPGSDHYSAFAAETGFTVNAGTPFWARVFVDPDLPVRDLVDMPYPTPQGLLQFANQLVGPHVSSIVDLNGQRDYGDVNAPAPFNAVLRSLAAMGFYDSTTDGDVRIPYWQRTIAETAMPFARDIIDPLTGGPSDPNRQQRLGIAEGEGFAERAVKSLGFGLGRAAGVQLSPPTDVKGAAGRSGAELDNVIESLRLQGKVPPAPKQGGASDIANIVFGG